MKIKLPTIKFPTPSAATVKQIAGEVLGATSTTDALQQSIIGKPKGKKKVGK